MNKNLNSINEISESMKKISIEDYRHMGNTEQELSDMIKLTKSNK